MAGKEALEVRRNSHEDRSATLSPGGIPAVRRTEEAAVIIKYADVPFHVTRKLIRQALLVVVDAARRQGRLPH